MNYLTAQEAAALADQKQYENANRELTAVEETVLKRVLGYVRDYAEDHNCWVAPADQIGTALLAKFRSLGYRVSSENKVGGGKKIWFDPLGSKLEPWIRIYW